MRRRSPHRPLSLSASHWRRDGSAKVRFGSRNEALVAAGERGEESGIDLVVYECAFCNGWHMGRPSGRTGE